MKNKPNLNMFFDNMPFIGQYLKQDYNKCNTYIDLLDLVHEWLSIAEITSNKTKSNYYIISANQLIKILKDEEINK